MRSQFGRRLFLFSFLAPLIVACDPGSDEAPYDPSTTLATSGTVEFYVPRGGTISFQLSNGDQRFVLQKRRTKDPKAVIEALQGSYETGRGVTVRFDLKDASIDKATNRPTYLVRELRYNEKTIQGMRGDAEPSEHGNETNAEAKAALARGVALQGANRPNEARVALDRAIAAKSLEFPLRRLAFKTRGYALRQEVAGTHPQPTDEGDQQLIRALADFETWAKLAPESSDPLFAIGSTLQSLGAFDEALQLYAWLGREWPEQYYRVAVRIGATHRQVGDFDKALQTLDRMVKKHGPQDGMMFHYHRARTLIELRRYIEAAAELSIGLKQQPDYQWAFVHRACAFAMSSQLKQAAADQEEAVRLMRSADEGARDPHWNENVQRAEAVLRELQQRAAEGATHPVSAPCEGYPNYGEQRRTRSRLLADPYVWRRLVAEAGR